MSGVTFAQYVGIKYSTLTTGSKAGDELVHPHANNITRTQPITRSGEFPGLRHNRSANRVFEPTDNPVLEIRRQLLPIVKIPRITAADLKGTRGLALTKFASELSPENFSRLAYLLKGLSPVAVISGNLDHVLHGRPDSRPLFPEMNPPTV